MVRAEKLERGNAANSNLKVTDGSSAAFEVVLRRLKSEGKWSTIASNAFKTSRGGRSTDLDELALQIIPLMMAAYLTSEIA